LEETTTLGVVIMSRMTRGEARTPRGACERSRIVKSNGKREMDHGKSQFTTRRRMISSALQEAEVPTTYSGPRES
jgi:hypothetical protein